MCQSRLVGGSPLPAGAANVIRNQSAPEDPNNLKVGKSDSDPDLTPEQLEQLAAEAEKKPGNVRRNLKASLDRMKRRKALAAQGQSQDTLIEPDDNNAGILT